MSHGSPTSCLLNGEADIGDMVAATNDEQLAPSDSSAVDAKSGGGVGGFPCDFDHMYASMTDNGATAASTATSPLRGNEPRHQDLTEVKHLKELLLLHLDLIQQQSEQLVTKDKLLAALKQENETLKLRLERMDRRVSLQKLRGEPSDNSGPECTSSRSPPPVNSVSVASTSDHYTRSSQGLGSSSPQYNETFKIRLNTSGGVTTVKQEEPDKPDVKADPDWEGKKKRRIDLSQINNNSSSKRKRGISSSSTVSNDTSSTNQDAKNSLHEGHKRSDKKNKPRKESGLTTEDNYYTALGETGFAMNLKEQPPADNSSSLEVPNWRLKVYTSCYTMEGTENLDDEIFNKRHQKLENDERRRKRWDVQRIREQRHIEKLRQRLERQNHLPTCYNTNHSGPCPSTAEDETISTLWPDIDQVQSLQVDPQLPVTAFGSLIPTFTPSEFTLPWVQQTKSKSRHNKRSSRRKSSKR